MKKVLKWSVLLVLLTAISVVVIGQQGNKPRPSPKALTMQRVGATDITIDYSRPGVKGRVIWGELVPYGLSEGNQYSNNKPYPWRAGANENTTFETSGALLVEGQKLPAGKYGLHIIPGESEWIIIFNKVNDAWGSFSYDESQDALRVTVKPAAAEHQEWLAYEFDDLTDNSATVSLHWEKLKVPFKVQVDQGS
jgi:hypothetical protein